jgi:hypothetical protein
MSMAPEEQMLLLEGSQPLNDAQHRLKRSGRSVPFRRRSNSPENVLPFDLGSLMIAVNPVTR